MTKEEIKSKLTELGIEFDGDAKKAELEALLPEEAPVEEKKASGIEIEVIEPAVLEPEKLPLVITPKGGKWANEAQEEYAGTLNAYAYSNKKKWEAKKKDLLEKLADLEKNPEGIVKLRGNIDKNKSVSYKNKLLQED